MTTSSRRLLRTLSKGLVVMDAFLKWPEVFIMKHATAEFTLKALRKTFIGEGVPAAVMTDNGRHFSAKSVTDWLRQIGS